VLNGGTFRLCIIAPPLPTATRLSVASLLSVAKVFRIRSS